MRPHLNDATVIPLDEPDATQPGDGSPLHPDAAAGSPRPGRIDVRPHREASLNRTDAGAGLLSARREGRDVFDADDAPAALPELIGDRPVPKIRRPRGGARRTRFLIALGAALAIAAATLAALVLRLAPGDGRIIPGARVSGIAIGGMELAAAQTLLSQRFSAAADQPVTLVDGQRSWEVTARDLGYWPDVQASVAAAAAVGRQGALPQRLREAWQARRHGFSLRARWQVDRRKLGRRLRKVARAARIPAQDARIRFDGRSFAITEEHSGRAVATDATEKNLVRYFDPLVKRQVALVTEVEEPRVHAEELRRIDGRLSPPFTTHFNLGDANRTVNLRLAAEALDGVVIPTRGVFSYNDSVGPRSIEKGYKVAKIFLKGKILDGIGGGICQVATTLYNAVCDAHLPVVERARHSHPVTYAPPGRDATVSYGGVDLRFRNNTGTPILIQTRVRGDAVTVSLYGRKPPEKAAGRTAARGAHGASG